MRTFSRITLYAVLAGIAWTIIKYLPDASQATQDCWR